MSLQNYKTQFEAFLTEQQSESANIIKERKVAFDNFVKLGFPTKKSELWQYTDLSTLIKSNYDLIGTNVTNIKEDLLNEVKIPNSMRIVIENGHINNELSDYNSVKIRNTFDTNANFNINADSSFLALNKAFANSGYSIEIGENFNPEQPLHIINIITDGRKNVQNHQINSITVGSNSSITIIEEFLTKSDNQIFNNIVNQIDIKENSHLNYSAIQNNDEHIINLNHVFVNQADSSTYNAQLFIKNGGLIRNEFDVQLNGENCDTNISGLVLLDSKDHIENYTSIIHNKPHCKSNQVFKYILKDSAEGVFNGLVKVQPHAQKTDSMQTNKNILLSKKALMNSNPQLEIYADDVKCTHGSATGELDEDTIFYLRTRGINLTDAKAILIEGFAKEILEEIKNESIRERSGDILLKWLAK